MRISILVRGFSIECTNRSRSSRSRKIFPKIFPYEGALELVYRVARAESSVRGADHTLVLKNKLSIKIRDKLAHYYHNK